MKKYTVYDILKKIDKGKIKMEKMKKVFNFIWKTTYRLFAVGVILMFVFATVQVSSHNKKSVFGMKIFTVITGSMIPVYDIGDILIVKDVQPEEIKVDDDIVYMGEKGTYRNKTITHRVQIQTLILPLQQIAYM